MIRRKVRERHDNKKLQLTKPLRQFVTSLITAVVFVLLTARCAVQPTTPAAAVERSAAFGQFGFHSCPQFFVAGVPPVIPSQPKLRELCYDGFAVLHSGSTRTPVFVAERLNRQLLLQARDLKRAESFFSDARLPRVERAELSDYKGSGYSRGHMAPAADMYSETSMAQSFSLVNIVPQNSKQNSGSWATIEKDTRAFVMRAQGDVFVITGPIFDANSSTVGANQVRVPSHLFKLVYDEKTGKAWAHWQPNSDEALAGSPISYNELRRRTGIQWLPDDRRW